MSKKFEDKIADSKLADYGIEDEPEVIEPVVADPVRVVQRTKLPSNSNPKAYRQGTQRRTKVDTQGDLLEIPDFLKRTTTHQYKPVVDDLTELAWEIADRGGKGDVVLSDNDVKRYVNCLHKTIGDTMEKGGLIWTAPVSEEFKASLSELVGKTLFSHNGTTHRKIKTERKE